MRVSLHWVALVAIASAIGSAAAKAAPPELYRQGAYESPVRGGPDDILLLAGFGFAEQDVIVYQAVSDTTRALPEPIHVPDESTDNLGVAQIVSAAQVPYSLTIRLPASLRADQSYALWVRNSAGEWARPVLINDARPLWMSPDHVYASASLVSMPRELKVVGRNLQPSAGHAIRIQLRGPEVYSAAALVDDRSSATMDHYVMRAALPKVMAVGKYRVAVSRDGVSWVELTGQKLEVRPDPPALPEYAVNDPRFGGCEPDDGADDTPCILRAIAAAQRAGGGVVYFPAGTWDLIDAAQAGLVSEEGMVVPDGVQLRGAGSELTRLERHREWTEDSQVAAFTLVGHTVVTGFTFRDLQTYQANDRAGAFFALGEDYRRVANKDPSALATVNDVVISHNTFNQTFIAIAYGGLPISHLLITYNTFGAYSAALELGGNQFNMTYKYRLEDSIIDYNTFNPGSKIDAKLRTGSMASEIGSGQRLDFSGNSADGSATKYLYAPGDARGWRAAFFWNMNGNFEQMLVSQNSASCTGDKIGDGEAISYDNNGNTFAFKSVVATASATAGSIAVSAPLSAHQNNRDIPIADYYVGHWVQIVSGPGIGQARKIFGYSTDPLTQLTTFRVAPDWDVVPVRGQTRLAVGREFWQTYTVDNQVDHRQPLCQKSNRSRHDGGVIAMYAQSADSVIEGNRQYDTDGILVEEAYIVPDHECAECPMGSFLQDFLEIRGNTIDGEYDWASDCSDSGIAIAIAASPAGDPAPPTIGYGVSISYNRIRRADAARGGAIAQVDPWFAGPEPNRWPLSESTIIQHNSIRDIDGPRALTSCGGGSVPRIGINFPHHDIAWRTVLYANSCTNVTLPIGGSGAQTTRMCPSSVADSCECTR